MNFSILLLLASATFVASHSPHSDFNQGDVDLICAQLKGHCGITLLRHLGTGGMGAVFSASYENGSYLAVKLSRSRSPEDALWNSAIQTELHHLQIAPHPQIVAYFGSTLFRYPECDILAIYTELLGPNLHSLLESIDSSTSGLGATVVTRIATQTSEGLAHLHSRFIAHHDIKTLNLVIDRELDLTQSDLMAQLLQADYKLIDLSLCVVYACPDDLEPLPYGTPHYFSPEKANADQSFNPFLADAYALGYALAEALLGPQIQAAMARKVQEDTGLDPSQITITEIYQMYRSLLPDSDNNLPIVQLIGSLVEADPAKRMTVIEFNRQLKQL